MWCFLSSCALRVCVFVTHGEQHGWRWTVSRMLWCSFEECDRPRVLCSGASVSVVPYQLCQPVQKGRGKLFVGDLEQSQNEQHKEGNGALSSALVRARFCPAVVGNLGLMTWFYLLQLAMASCVKKAKKEQCHQTSPTFSSGTPTSDALNKGDLQQFMFHLQYNRTAHILIL